jgi:hypothetical protein
VVEAGDNFNLLARIPMEQTKVSFSTIAVANKKLFIRTPSSLFCIGKK